MTMPDLQGTEVATALWQLRPQTRIVLMSGYSAEAIGKAFPSEALAGFLSSPSPRRLFSTR